MSFAVSAESYDRFMGRYSQVLTPLFADFAYAGPLAKTLEVGCGPGALTGELVERLGPGAITAVDPSRPFLEAINARYPSVTVYQASAESLPFGDESYDAVVAQLVVHLMDDPTAGLAEMVRVCRADGVVAACVWDVAGGRSPLNPFWSAAKTAHPAAVDETSLPGTRQGQLGEMFHATGLIDVVEEPITFQVGHADFDDWWEPFNLGVGPAGSYLARLDPDERARVEAIARRAMPKGPFTLDLQVWAARGTPRRGPESRASEPATFPSMDPEAGR